MGGILVVAEHDGGAFKATAWELLGAAAQLAAATGASVSAAVLGDAPAAELGGFASRVYQASGDFGTYDTGRVTDALAACVSAASPDVVLASWNFAAKDALPRLAARFGGAMISEATSVKIAGGSVIGRRPLYAGRAYADVTVDAKPAFVAVRAKSYPAPEARGGAAEVVPVAWQPTTPQLEVVETLAPASTGIDVATADRVVAGGRSLKSKESFDSLIRPLASALGAGVGASRAATDAGYAPHSEQIGQTGQTVNPTLYIAVGISGAIQHLAGMRTSKVIVAINKDPDAPIFEHATYGIVNDLFDVVPALTQALKG